MFHTFTRTNGSSVLQIGLQNGSIPSGLSWSTPSYRVCGMAILTCLWALSMSFLGSSLPTLRDGAIVLALFIAQNRSIVYASIEEAFYLWGFQTKYTVLGIGFVALAVYSARIISYKLSSPRTQTRATRRRSDEASLQPQIFPCRTSHTRLFPVVHSFSYSYLYVGIPISKVDTGNKILSAEPANFSESSGSVKNNSSWFSVRSEDYLQRTSHSSNLLEKLHKYLESCGIDDRQYPYAYLVTAPRFLGFSFNPVSFWYLYSTGKVLMAMILEVNNTFDERRMYFLEKTNSLDDDASLEHSWDKDFHVSPFNDREGRYNLKARDPFAPGFTGNGGIDNVITLLSPEGKPKLIARVYSTNVSILASKVTTWESLPFICGWWWVGFMTNVRILKEARKLWTKGLQVFYRPEVFKTSIGRTATIKEDFLEGLFLKFVCFVQKHSSDEVVIRYTAAAGKDRGTTKIIPAGGAISKEMNTNTTQDSEQVMDLHILSPAFYSQFFKHTDAVEAFKQLCECPIGSERHASLSNSSIFLARLEKFQNHHLLPSKNRKSGNHYFTLLNLLRDQKLWQALAVHIQVQVPIISRFQRARLHPESEPAFIDRVVFDLDPDQWLRYRRTLSLLLVADRLALGSVGFLRFYGHLLRFILLWLLSGEISVLVRIGYCYFYRYWHGIGVVLEGS